MRIAVKTLDIGTYYLNFDLIVEFLFSKYEREYFVLSYTSETSTDYEIIKISEEEKNKILKKLGL